MDSVGHYLVHLAVPPMLIAMCDLGGQLTATNEKRIHEKWG